MTDGQINRVVLGALGAVCVAGLVVMGVARAMLPQPEVDPRSEREVRAAESARVEALRAEERRIAAERAARDAPPAPRTPEEARRQEYVALMARRRFPSMTVGPSGDELRVESRFCDSPFGVRAFLDTQTPTAEARAMGFRSVRCSAPRGGGWCVRIDRWPDGIDRPCD